MCWRSASPNWPHDLAALRRRPPLPFVEGGFGRRGDLLVVGGRALGHRAERFAGRRVQRFDDFARGLEPFAGEGAAILGPEAETGEEVRNGRRARGGHQGLRRLGVETPERAGGEILAQDVKRPGARPGGRSGR